ncbi:hypothetical protein P344_03695 [Spiroplasma mirum ATCC 29335]|uniref:Uncharacterized protein n=1 Tax=Spiroplasma mirum ATCC 29335 TaxID=838561 RepID=W0GLB4_9MOLU|nr:MULTISPECIES: hypothetical protein [Spiroplasma]AHF61045.1 putative transmembrane protein [Spiroplasma mirum ATCC 29335]AHI58080.1 hypothetical protein P344_03695 [Spiroplasma mirum ATCC 29335]AKM53148.1 hypothetical protein SATRI_v1c06860 [Spiroplasma atrichopogonis]
MTTIGWVFIGLFIGLSLIFLGFLIWFNYKKKHLIFEIFKKLEVDNQSFINNDYPQLTVNPIKVKIKLQRNEVVYYTTAISSYLMPLLDKKQVSNYSKSKYVIEFPGGINVGYTGKNRFLKNPVPVVFQEGYLFITNQRILIVNPEITTIWELTKITNLELSIIRINQRLYQGFFLYYEQSKYFIISNDLKTPYLIKKVQTEGE